MDFSWKTVKPGGFKNETIYEKNKIGNLLILLINKVNAQGETMLLTKLLKLLYIIDEQAVLETGSPVTFLPYKAWQMGPVATPIYAEGKDNDKFNEFVDVVETDGQFAFHAKRDFNAGDFCKYELNLVNRVFAEHGHKTASQLIDFTHRVGSLYDSTVKKHGLKFTDKKRTSKKDVPLKEIADNDPFHKMAYETAMEGTMFQHYVNNM